MADSDMTKDTVPLYVRTRQMCTSVRLAGTSVFRLERFSLLGWLNMKPDREGIVPDQHTVRCLKVAVVFAALVLPLEGRAQTLTTSDSLLNTGSALSITYTAPGTSGPNGIVHSSSNPSTTLWLMYPNPWGVKTGSGTINMNYSGSGSIATSINLSGIPGGGVDGYPFVLYGCDPYRGAGSPCYNGQPPQFPQQLSAMSSLQVDFTYALSGTYTGSRNVDVLFDEWVCKTSQPTDIPDCLELMVMPYYSFAPGGWTFYKTISEPATINGVPGTLSFDEYYWGAGSLLIAPHGLPGPSSAEMKFDLLSVMNKGVADYGSIFNDHSFSWLMGIELGTEFGANSTQSYNLTLTKLQLDQTLGGSKPAAPTNLSDTVK
jgi:hypothetical protein